MSDRRRTPGHRGWPARIRAFASEWAALALGAIVAFALVFLAVTLIRDGEPNRPEPVAEPAPAGIEATRSSWVVGQESLASYSAYGPIAARASALASDLVESREALLERIERALQRAERHEERAAIRAFRRAQRLAERRYERALARAERQRERLERKRERQQRALEERLEELREKHKIEPGEECTLPEVQELFDCSTGYPF